MSKHIVKLTKRSAYSYSVTVPKEIIDKYGWRTKQKLTIEDKGRGVVVLKDWRRTG
jgi:bifunctional DNA-binding transcriptional regulator/antitoxin component of YhaV-PrlF toxin-antitoxin module